MRLLFAAALAAALPVAAAAQDAPAATPDSAAPAAAAPAPSAGELPVCGPAIRDRCQQSPAAERLAAAEYKGGGRDNSAAMKPRRAKRRS